MYDAIEFISQEDYIKRLRVSHITRGSLVTVSTADWHFGAFEPSMQFEFLKEGLFDKITDIHFDIFVIAGDMFHHKFMSNSDAILYGTLAFRTAIDICKRKNATLVVIHGTSYHDADQLKLFYQYLKDPELDLRIVERMKFEYIKGAKVLCIPEEYDKGNEYYSEFLFKSGVYDMVFMHGALKGALYTAESQESGLHSSKAPIFTMNDFVNCRGLIVSGHVHKPGCFETYFYYCGSPYRWRFDDDHNKGFLVCLLNLDTGAHHVHFEHIKSHVYETINLDEMLASDPKDVIQYVQRLKDEKGIDFIRLEFLIEPKEAQLANLEIIKNYYRNNNKVKLKIENHEKNKLIEEAKNIVDEYEEHAYLFDESLSPEQIFTIYVNKQMGYEYITVDELILMLKDTI